MKKTIITLGAIAALSGVGMAANAESSTAATTGLYATAGMGYIRNNISDNQAHKFGGAKKQVSGLYSRLGLGYNINSMIGIEGDWYHLPSLSVSATDGTARSMMFTSANKLALLGTVRYPVSERFDVTGAAGVAYAMYHTSAKAVPINTGSKEAKPDASYNRVALMIQGGVEYKASQNIGLDVNVNYTFKSGQVPSAVGADFGVKVNF